MKKIVLLFLLLSGFVVMNAAVKLPTPIGDNMVLQQLSEAVLWGEAAPGATVTVTPSWSGDATTCTADADGQWKLRVATPEASFTPYSITFADGPDAVTVGNVLIGEVWLASGQSNMQMPMKGFPGCCVDGGIDDAIAAAELPGVRMFNVPLRQSYSPQATCGGYWMTTEKFTDVLEFSATAYYFASNLSRALHIPVGIINCAYGGTRVESWLPKEILEGYADIPTDSATVANSQPDYLRQMVTYNGMFYAIRHYTVKGIIWYQGCGNVGSHETYAERLATMVDYWRTDMEQADIPFYFVEIAPYDYGSGDYGSGARLREQQFKAQSLIPNSAMISTNDLVESYERYNIHPSNKKMVGHRLSYLALALTYGNSDICCFGPQYKSWTAKGEEAWIAFDHVEMGICRNYELQGFELAGEDRVFYPADAAWYNWETNEIVIKSANVPVPVAVRYCFRDFQPGTMIGGNQLPTVPFRTDDW